MHYWKLQKRSGVSEMVEIFCKLCDRSFMVSKEDFLLVTLCPYCGAGEIKQKEACQADKVQKEEDNWWEDDEERA